MVPRKHYLSTRANWQHDGLKKASKSEDDAFALFDKIIDAKKYQVDIKPKDAAHLYMDKMRLLGIPLNKMPRKCGIVPEMSILNRSTGKKVFVEIKHQQDAGNAHERAGKYFAPGIIRRLQKIGDLSTFPVFFIFVGGIVDGRKSAKYKAELSTWFDDPSVQDRVLLWHNRDSKLLKSYFEDSIRPAIDNAPKSKGKNNFKK